MRTDNQRYGAKFGARTLVRVGVLAAIGFVLMLFEFNLPPFPAFLQYSPADVPVLLGGFAMGPGAGIGIVTVRNLLFTLSGKDEAGLIGTVANYAAALPLVAVASWLYARRRSLAGAALGMAGGLVAVLISTSLGNYFIFLPAWGIGDPAVRQGLIWTTLIPFNIVKVVLTGTITFLLYKRVRDWM